jgi:nucleoside-diphosphate-sugar epimerase
MGRIIITGGSGFIGTNAVEYFYSKGYKVLNIDIKKPQNKLHNQFLVDCDIRNREKYIDSCKKFDPDYFLHLAARTDLKENNNLSGYDSNILGVENTIDVINKCENIKRVIFASSRMVCKIGYTPRNSDDYCPPNLYGESKVKGEILIKTSKINPEWIIVRPTSIWGPWFDSPYKTFFTIIQKRFYFHPGKYNPPKSFGFVGNSVYQLSKLLNYNSTSIGGKVIYLCDYPPLYLKEWVRLIQEEMNISFIPSFPYPLIQIAAKIGDVFKYLGYYRTPLSSFKISNLITDMTYNTGLLEEICGVLPFTLHDGVKVTVEWLNNSRI